MWLHIVVIVEVWGTSYKCDFFSKGASEALYGDLVEILIHIFIHFLLRIKLCPILGKTFSKSINSF